jgi:hypothetical protein
VSDPGVSVQTPPVTRVAASQARASHNNPRSWVPPWRVVTAKFLELRRRRGLIIAVLILTLGIVVVIDAIFLILHAAAPHSYGPAGGLSKFRAFSIAFVDTFGISAVLIGAAAGSSDLTDGMFRHLVVTGRSRLALFAARIPAGLMLIIPITAFTYAIEAIVGALFAPAGTVTSIVVSGSGPFGGAHPVHQSATPGVELLVVTGLWLMLQVVVAFVLGLGLGAVTGSRYVTVAILIALQIIVTPILSGVTIPHLINLQRAFVGVAIVQLEPSGLIGFGGGGGGGGNMGNLLGIAPMPTFGLAIVITAWVVGWLAIGAWRTARRDA